MRNYETYRGVGLFEYLLSLLLFTILLTAAAPSYVRLKQFYQVRESTQSIAALLHQSRIESMRSRMPIYVHIATQGADNDFWRVAIHADSTPRSFEQIISGASGIAQGDHQRLTSTQSVIGFSPYHGRAQSAGHIKLQLTDSAQAVKIIYHNSSGRVRMCSVQGSVYGYKAC